MRVIQIYEAEDGTTHRTQKECVIHEAMEFVKNFTGQALITDCFMNDKLCKDLLGHIQAIYEVCHLSDS